MAASELNTTQLKGSFDLLTTENGEIPEYLINGVPAVGVAGGVAILTGDAGQTVGVGAYFSEGNNELTLLDHTTQSQGFFAKSRSGNLTLTNPFGNVIIPSSTGSSVVVTATVSYFLWPTELGWEYTG